MLDLITKSNHYLKFILSYQHLILFIYTFSLSMNYNPFYDALVAKKIPPAQCLNTLEAFYLLQKLQCLIKYHWSSDSHLN